MTEFENIDNQLPYNPSDVDIRQQHFSVGQISEMITHGDIELWRQEDYQRKSNQWSNEQKSRLIESLIMRIPLPIFYFDGSNSPWKIIDGLHRLTTFFTFLKEPSFELVNLEYLKALEGKNFFELPFNYRRVIEKATIEAYIINPGTPEKIKLNIFQRINTGGSRLSRQEIRNAYYRGKPSEFIDALAEGWEYRRITNKKISKSKMRDKEVVLRFFSFYSFLDTYNPPLEKFLDISMEKIGAIDERILREIESRFKESMNVCFEIFQENSFYILNAKGQKQSSSMNIALLEAWAVNIAKLEFSEIKKILDEKKIVVFKFIKILEDTEFYKSISTGTSSKKAVNIRFNSIKKLITDITNAN